MRPLLRTYTLSILFIQRRFRGRSMRESRIYERTNREGSSGLFSRRRAMREITCTVLLKLESVSLCDGFVS